MARISTLVVGDHEIFWKGLRCLLESRAECEICGEASSGLEAVEAARKLTPDIVAMDIGMPYVNGLNATKQILKELPKTGILILSQHDSPHTITAARDAGALADVTSCKLPTTSSWCSRRWRKENRTVGKQRGEFTTESYFNRCDDLS